MKDTEAFVGVALDSPLMRTICPKETAAEKLSEPWRDLHDSVVVEPVVIVSKARYEALETCERIVHGRAIEMCEERGAEGETKEVACG